MINIAPETASEAIELIRRAVARGVIVGCGHARPHAERLREAAHRCCAVGVACLQPGDHVLEIGTGWGGFALYAAGNYGCRVTTTTISAEQYELQGDVIKVSVSIGAAIRSNGEALESLQQRAAASLRETRAAGTRT